MNPRYYPVLLDVRNRSCLVVGGGSVGTRKALGLLDCGARVAVVGPDPSDTLGDLEKKGVLVLKRRAYRSSDLDGVFLVIGATDDEPLNRLIHAEAEARNILCNIADRPEECSFILPSVIRRGDLVIAVSTSGKSPAYAKKLRESLEGQFGEEHAEFLRLMGALRKRLLSRGDPPEANKHLFEALIDRGLIERIRDGRPDEVDGLLRQVLGEGFRYRDFQGKD